MSNESKYRDQLKLTLTTPATAIAFSVVCGFKPKHVIVQNITSLSKMEWWEGMADASALITTAGTGVITLVTTHGITVPDTAVYNVNTTGDVITTVGSASANEGVGFGFTVGLNSTVNILSEDLVIFAE